MTFHSTDDGSTQALRFTIGKGNRVTGLMMTIMAARLTCPPSCAFFKQGCYALYGPLSWIWEKVAQRGVDFRQLLLEMRAYALRMSRLLKIVYVRYGIAGDLPGEGDAIDGEAVRQLAETAKDAGATLYAYTHKPMTPENQKIVKWANENGFVVNLSANGLRHADQLANLKIAPVVAAVADTDAKYTPEGRKAVYCPEKMGKTDKNGEPLTCSFCGLCMKQRLGIILFPAHGAGKNHVKRIVKEWDERLAA